MSFSFHQNNRLPSPQISRDLPFLPLHSNEMVQRPTLKLKLTTAPQSPSTPSNLTPSSGGPKIKLKINSNPKTSGPPSSDPAPPSKAKAARKPKKEHSTRISTPTAKKRDLAASTLSDEDDIEEGHLASKSSPLPHVKRIKLKTRAPSTPFIRLKNCGRPPNRPLGVGYDSEASDREEDPAIEEEFILRMTPGPDCDYLRQAVIDKRFGVKSEGGADVRMRFLQPDGRRAVVTIQGRHYAASMVDLPCIVEGMKSWDRRGWWKTADICQMLLVLGRVDNEDEALNFPLPTRDLDEKTWQYSHGLTPPMRWVRRRRFRKRISNRTIEAVEEEVERLCKVDEEFEGEISYEMLDLEHLAREESTKASGEEEQAGYNTLGDAGMQGGLDYGEQDAEGDIDDGPTYFEAIDPSANADDDGLEADLERAMMMDADEADDSGALTQPMPTPSAIDTAPPSAAATPFKNDDSGDDSSDEDVDTEVDEDLLEQQQDLQRQREEIADLEAAIKGQEAELERLQNPILKQKLVKKIQSLRADWELKRGAIGEGGDD